MLLDHFLHLFLVKLAHFVNLFLELMAISFHLRFELVVLGDVFLGLGQLLLKLLHALGIMRGFAITAAVFCVLDDF